MRVKLRVMHTDLLEHHTAVLCEGFGLYDNEVLRYRESAPFSGSDTAEFGNTEIVLVHRGETESVTVLRVMEAGTARVTTPFGEMECETVLRRYERYDERILVEYDVLQEAAVVSRIRLEYFLHPEGAESLPC